MPPPRSGGGIFTTISELSCTCKEESNMKSYSSREVIKILEADGWYLVRGKPPPVQTSDQKRQGNGETPGQEHPDRHAEKYRKTGRAYIQVSPQLPRSSIDKKWREK